MAENDSTTARTDEDILKAGLRSGAPIEDDEPSSLEYSEHIDDEALLDDDEADGRHPIHGDRHGVAVYFDPHAPGSESVGAFNGIDETGQIGVQIDVFRDLAHVDDLMHGRHDLYAVLRGGHEGLDVLGAPRVDPQQAGYNLKIVIHPVVHLPDQKITGCGSVLKRSSLLAKLLRKPCLPCGAEER